jgi:hypothetical protein
MRWQRSKCRCRLSRSRLLSAGSLPCAAPGNREVRSAATVRTLNQPCLNSLAQRCARLLGRMHRLNISIGIAWRERVHRRTPLPLERQAAVARVTVEARSRACVAVTAIFQVGVHWDGMAVKEDIVVKSRAHRVVQLPSALTTVVGVETAGSNSPIGSA